MEKINFYDTCSLIDLQQEVFDTNNKFYISSITLSELENIKTSTYKDEEVKYNARNILRLLEKYPNKYETIIYNEKIAKLFKKFGLIDNADTRIIATAYYLTTKKYNIVFISSDLSCRSMAQSIGLITCGIKKIQSDSEYKGFKTITLNDMELANFYNNDFANNINKYLLLNNEYLIIKTPDNKIIDKYKWRENCYYKIPYIKAESSYFGKISPFNGDVYQQLALDSLQYNQITMLRGRAGTGKSMLSFGYMFSLLEKGMIDKIVVFCNTVAAKGSAKLGFYPGTRIEKLLDSQIGNLLESKLGDRLMVEKLINDGQLLLLPLSDIRGFDTTGMNAAVYISEAQNLDIELMRLALQRIGDDSICIIDGDFLHQTDLSMYAGRNNGMRRVSEVFRGQSFYGEIELQHIHRSKIAEIAEQL